MSEQQLQFRVGVFVICAMTAVGMMMFQFGDVRGFWEHPQLIVINFDRAPGIHASSPVRKSGIRIGKVREVELIANGQGVRVELEIDEGYVLREDAQPQIVRSLLGDASIDFVPGKSRVRMKPGAVLVGKAPDDPMQTVMKLEERLSSTVEAIEETSREWQKVGQNVNALVETNRGSLGMVVERAAASLDEFTNTMRTANSTLSSANELISDPEHRENLKQTLGALPELLRETRATITLARSSIGRADESLKLVTAAAKPLANRSDSIAREMEATMKNLSVASAEMERFSRLLREEDGTLQMLVKNPSLYKNLDQSAANLAVLLKNVEPVLRDLRIFSDKVARHPELFGISGAIRGSSGLKDVEPKEPGPIRQTSGTRSLRQRP